ncbi:mitochondrial amidoxime-reducing component 1 isoform X3 [Nycticebus coucang]|uniref:mitochondrial amidoxime-reducing component 1 isoform X3 n=1 Tax=Nycticebus coucang TaxID=9470 RepID=UPI00234C6157|nr:mitochondrial amidoxime-reducing component 1 isoform X3 [Nycticebus coucang]
MGAGSSALARLGLPAPRLLARPGSGWLGVAVLGMAAVVLGAVAWLRGRSRRRRRLQQVGAVAQLWIYPVKSCKGVPVSSAECTAMGLRSGHLRDRFWLVINEEGNMVTARQEPRLVLISLTCDGDALTLSAAYTKDLLLPIQMPTTNTVRRCRVHGLEIEGRDCGEAAAQWITSFLKTQPYRLVHFEPHMRPRHPQQIKDLFPAKERIAYPDASPFLILSEASLADLNSRLEKKVKATNFRPNIIISGCGVYAETQTCFFPPVLCALPIPGLVLLQCSPPGIIRWKEDSHAHLARSVNELTYLKREGTRRCVNTCWLPRTEDSWDVLRIGDVELKRVMACSRCILTTVDPDTGIMSRKEPLETLKSYRKCDPSEQKLYGKSPLFGQYFVLENPGTIKVGDPVYLLSQ